MDNLVNYIDLTTLRSDFKDNIPEIISAIQDSGLIPASVCTWLQHSNYFPKIVQLGTQVSVVLNFSTGSHSIDKVNKEIALINANPWISEVDYVVDYKSYQHGDREQFKRKMRELDKRIEKPVKAILETSSFDVLPYDKRERELANMANEVLNYGCVEMLKTSTGRHFNGGAKLTTVSLLLDVIKNHPRSHVGLKVSGGVRDIQEASEYFVLASKYYGDNMSPIQFRIGASSLYEELTNNLSSDITMQY